MYIHYFIQIMNFLKKEASDNRLLLKYIEFDEKFKYALHSKSVDYSEKLIASRDNILAELNQYEFNYNLKEEISMLDKVDKYSVFGKAAIFYLNGLNLTDPSEYKGIHTEIVNKIKMFKKQLNAISEFYEVFDHSLLADLLGEVNDVPETGVYIHFEGNVAVKNISDLERFTRIWNSILQSFTDLSGFETQSLEFKNLQNKAVVLGVVMENNTLEAFMKGSLGILSARYIIEKIRKIQNQLLPLQLSNNYFEMLEDEIELIIDTTANKIAEELILEYYKSDRNAITRITDNLAISLKQIINFVDKGGWFNCIPQLDSIEGEALSKSLKSTFGMQLSEKNDSGLTHAGLFVTANELEKAV